MHKTQKLIEQGSGRKFIGGFRTRQITTTAQNTSGTKAQRRLLRQEIRKLMKDQGLWADFLADGHEHKLKNASLDQLLEIKKDLQS